VKLPCSEVERISELERVGLPIFGLRTDLRRQESPVVVVKMHETIPYFARPSQRILSEPPSERKGFPYLAVMYRNRLLWVQNNERSHPKTDDEWITFRHEDWLIIDVRPVDHFQDAKPPRQPRHISNEHIACVDARGDGFLAQAKSRDLPGRVPECFVCFRREQINKISHVSYLQAG